MASIEESIMLEESVIDLSNDQTENPVESKEQNSLLGPEELKEALAIVKAAFDRAVQNEENIFNKSMDIFKNEHASMVALYRSQLETLNHALQEAAAAPKEVKLEILQTQADVMDKLEAENEQYTKMLQASLAKSSRSRHEIWMTTVKVYGLLMGLANGAVDLKQDPRSLKRLTKSLNKLLLQPDFLEIVDLDEADED